LVPPLAIPPGRIYAWNSSRADEKSSTIKRFQVLVPLKVVFSVLIKDDRILFQDAVFEVTPTPLLRTFIPPRGPLQWLEIFRLRWTQALLPEHGPDG
jgi:hypothetical protein